MIWKIISVALVWSVTVLAEEAPAHDFSGFYEYSEGQYQVVAQGGRDAAVQVNQFMNVMLQQYSKFFSNWTPKAAARVIVFTNRDDFRAYTLTATKLTHNGLLGYCHLKTDEKTGEQFYELVTYDHETVWTTLAHEGFHQFLGYELGTQVPTWLNEGLAQYFETSVVARNRLKTGAINSNKLAAAQALVRSRQTPSLAEIMAWDRGMFYSNAQIGYPLSWGLVYFLLEGNGGSFHNSAFRKYLQDIKWGANNVRSFQNRFGRDPQVLQSNFEQYILHLRPAAE